MESPFLQILCLAEQIQFTERCETAIRSNSLMSLHEFSIEMESQLDSYANTDMSGGAGDAASNVLELKCKALILDTIHAIDVVEKLVKNNVKSTEDWLWQKQLRFYIEKGMVASVLEALFRKYFGFLRKNFLYGMPSCSKVLDHAN